MSIKNSGFKFAARHDVPVLYMERSHSLYEAMGYPKHYNYAHLAEVPFTALTRPLDQASITVITTAAPVEDGKDDQSPGAPTNPIAMPTVVYSAPCVDPPTLGISHLHYDRAHTDGGIRMPSFP